MENLTWSDTYKIAEIIYPLYSRRIWHVGGIYNEKLLAIMKEAGLLENLPKISIDSQEKALLSIKNDLEKVQHKIYMEKELNIKIENLSWSNTDEIAKIIDTIYFRLPGTIEEQILAAMEEARLLLILPEIGCDLQKDFLLMIEKKLIELDIEGEQEAMLNQICP